MTYIEAKNEQLSAIVNTYQALGGGLVNFQYPNGVVVSMPESELPSPTIPKEESPTLVPPTPEKAKEQNE